jgi:hypothetical protein
MGRPVTKADAKHLRDAWYPISTSTDKMLGLIICWKGSPPLFAYQMTNAGEFCWVLERTINLRKKIGRPKKRFKQIMKDPDFGLDELAKAMEIMERL